MAPEVILALAIPLLALGGFLWLHWNLPLPGCLFHSVTSWPCLTCGMSRGARELLDGQFLAAFFRNPLNLLLPLGAAMLWIYALLALARVVPALRPHAWSQPLSRRVRIALLAGAAFLWAYLLLRAALA
jgi:flagellar biosynthesis protein FliR